MISVGPQMSTPSPMLTLPMTRTSFSITEAASSRESSVELFVSGPTCPQRRAIHRQARSTSVTSHDTGYVRSPFDEPENVGCRDARLVREGPENRAKSRQIVSRIESEPNAGQILRSREVHADRSRDGVLDHPSGDVLRVVVLAGLLRGLLEKTEREDLGVQTFRERRHEVVRDEALPDRSVLAIRAHERVQHSGVDQWTVAGHANDRVRAEVPRGSEITFENVGLRPAKPVDSESVALRRYLIVLRFPRRGDDNLLDLGRHLDALDHPPENGLAVDVHEALAGETNASHASLNDTRYSRHDSISCTTQSTSSKFIPT